MTALPLPNGISEGAGADVTEVMRVWWNVDHPAMIIRPVHQDPAVVGALLAELAWHFSNAYAEKRGFAREETLAAIQGGFGEAMRLIPLETTERAR